MTSSTLDGLASALAGRYTIVRELGRGGMATVYLADDLKHHRRVARGWETLGSVSYPQIAGARHAPHGWREWMLARGAVEGDSEGELSPEQSFSQDWRVV